MPRLWRFTLLSDTAGAVSEYFLLQTDEAGRQALLVQWLHSHRPTATIVDVGRDCLFTESETAVAYPATYVTLPAAHAARTPQPTPFGTPQPTPSGDLE